MIGYHAPIPGGLNKVKVKLPSKLVQNPHFDNCEIRIVNDEIHFFVKDHENGNLYSEIWIHNSSKDAWQQITFEFGN